ncbi:hypothetical protein AB0K12_42625 [Nonomuraea sp. NPDC049419]|uniref:hypothetical protein n=1 Tax=Nonomuraea sp. NPDC049419 TaxID=3155772 RepID=UPI00343C6243
MRIEYRYQYRSSDQPYPRGVPAGEVDPGWHVHEGLRGTDNQAILSVGPDAEG